MQRGKEDIFTNSKLKAGQKIICSSAIWKCSSHIISQYWRTHLKGQMNRKDPEAAGKCPTRQAESHFCETLPRNVENTCEWESAHLQFGNTLVTLSHMAKKKYRQRHLKRQMNRNIAVQLTRQNQISAAESRNYMWTEWLQVWSDRYSSAFRECSCHIITHG